MLFIVGSFGFCPLQKELRHSGLSRLAAPSSHKADESDLAYLTLLDHFHDLLSHSGGFHFLAAFAPCNVCGAAEMAPGVCFLCSTVGLTANAM